MVYALRVSNPRELLSVKDTAARLGVHENTVRNWVRSGVLRSARVPERGSIVSTRLRLSGCRRLVGSQRRRLLCLADR